jgi:lysophospholipase
VSGFATVERWTAPDGARLALRRQPPPGAPRAACVMVHGFGEHAGRYAHVAVWLAARGVAVFALDQRGSGRSPGTRGHVARFAQYLGDIVALRRLVAAEAPGPLLLFGHSHGGLVVLRYLETAPDGVAGAIVTSPYLALAFRPPRWKRWLAVALADVAPALPLPTGVVLEHLSRDPAVVEAVRYDPDCHRRITPRAHRETLEAQRAVMAERNRIAVPVFLGLAGDDRLVSTPAARAFAADLPGEVTVRVYPGFFHEILNEPDRGRVLADVEPWLDRILGG